MDFCSYIMCMSVYLCTKYVQVITETRRNIGTPNWSYDLFLVTRCGGWESNPGPLHKYQMLLASESSVQPHD